MEQETNTQTQVEEKDDFLEQLQELKNNTVSKEEFEKLAEQNKRYKKALLEGSQIKEEENKISEEDEIKELIKYFAETKQGTEDTAYNYNKKALRLRNLYRDKTDVDLWEVPNAIGKKDSGDDMAEAISYAIDSAEKSANNEREIPGLFLHYMSNNVLKDDIKLKK